MRTITVEIEAPRNLKAGELFEVEIEVPAPEKKKRGQLAGIELVDMTDEQLKRELINANSVLYKAQQRGASAETVAANQARVEAAKAEKARRTPAAPAEENPELAGVMEADVDAEVAAEL